MRLVVCVLVCFVAALTAGAGRAETERGVDSSLLPRPTTAPRSVSARPITREAKRWHPNPAWMRDALCIYKHENGGYGWHANTGNGYSGGMQFLPSTWHRAGGRGLAYQWAAREQLYRAWRIWRMYPGGSWVEWGTRGMCGL